MHREQQRSSAKWAEWIAFALAVLAALFAVSVLLAQEPPEKAAPDPVPVKVVHPVPSSDTTLAAVWMAGISGVLALGSAAVQAYTSRKAAADKMAFDSELIKLRSENDRYRDEFEKCEARSNKLEAEIVELRSRLAVAESKLAQIAQPKVS